MKDGRTHLAYKAEHVVDLETDLVLAAEVYRADAADVDTIGPSLSRAQENLMQAESDAEIEEAVADKGYRETRRWRIGIHRGTTNVHRRTENAHRRNWKNKPDEQRRAVTNNRRRVGPRGRVLQRGEREGRAEFATSARRAAVDERGCTASRE